MARKSTSTAIEKVSDDELRAALGEAERTLALRRKELAKMSAVTTYAYDEWRTLTEETARRVSLLDGAENDYATILLGEPDTKVSYQRYLELMRRFGLKSGGTWIGTGQRCVGIKFTHEDSASNVKQIEGLLELLPFITPLPESCNGRTTDSEIVGCKPVDIMESTLSEYGIYNMFVRIDNTVVLSFTRYGSTTYKEIGDFNAAMKYIQLNHWYERIKPDRDDDDDMC